MQRSPHSTAHLSQSSSIFNATRLVRPALLISSSFVRSSPSTRQSLKLQRPFRLSEAFTQGRRHYLGSHRLRIHGSSYVSRYNMDEPGEGGSVSQGSRVPHALLVSNTKKRIKESNTNASNNQMASPVVQVSSQTSLQDAARLHNGMYRQNAVLQSMMPFSTQNTETELTRSQYFQRLGSYMAGTSMMETAFIVKTASFTQGSLRLV
ncbi:hypothetical protein BKA81DRAFT_231352 [Phyllosticta paracitricarpa]